MKTISKILLLATIALVGVGCEPNSPSEIAIDYYWYNGAKIPLERGNQEYIIYDEALLLESDKEKLIESGTIEDPELANLRWGITQPDAVLEDTKHVIYRIPSYTNNEGEKIFVTHRFCVQLKNADDLTLLQNLAKQYNVAIEQDADFPLWYILRCGLPSEYNALELANIFYESDLFAASEPEFIGGISSRSNRALFNIFL